MKKQYLLVFLTLLYVCSCKSDVEQPKVLEKGCGFDIEKVDFNENVYTLYSKHVLNELDIACDSVSEKILSDTIFRYRISNIVAQSMNFRLPEKEFGYEFRTPEIDSIARFNNIYFSSLYTLTDMRKKPVAFYAETRFDSLKVRNSRFNEFKKKYGEPTHSFFISSEFNQCCYEWDLTDRTIQIETSYGWEASFGFDEKPSSGKYYRLDMLIVANKAKKEIERAHLFNIPDQIMYHGKRYSNKDLFQEKTMIVKDNFLLYSSDKSLVMEEKGIYNIVYAKEDE